MNTVCLYCTRRLSFFRNKYYDFNFNSLRSIREREAAHASSNRVAFSISKIIKANAGRGDFNPYPVIKSFTKASSYSLFRPRVLWLCRFKDDKAYLVRLLGYANNTIL